MAVPKKKTAKSRSKVRYKHYQNQQQQKIQNRVSLTKCSSCGATKQTHTVCGACGQYRGREVIVQQEVTTKKTRIQA